MAYLWADMDLNELINHYRIPLSTPEGVACWRIEAALGLEAPIIEAHCMLLVSRGELTVSVAGRRRTVRAGMFVDAMGAGQGLRLLAATADIEARALLVSEQFLQTFFHHRPPFSHAYVDAIRHNPVLLVPGDGGEGEVGFGEVGGEGDPDNDGCNGYSGGMVGEGGSEGEGEREVGGGVGGENSAGRGGGSGMGGAGVARLARAWDDVEQAMAQTQHVCHREMLDARIAIFLMEVADVFARRQDASTCGAPAGSMAGAQGGSMADAQTDAQASSQTGSKVGTRRQALLEAFTQLLHTHIGRAHTVAFYADRLCVTPQYLGRVLRQHTGKSVAQTIDEELLRQTLRMILETDLTMQAIADAMGFSSQAALTAFVKRLTGATPMQHRKQ